VRKVKICGLKEPGNITAIMRLHPDYMGFIFHNPSPRNIGEITDELRIALKAIPEEVRKVGVFVNEEIHKILELGQQLDLQMIQLHGEESPDYCARIRENGFEVIKVIKTGMEKINNSIKEYQTTADYFLFEKEGRFAGGNNEVFNWKILEEIQINKNFFLSGGISPANYQQTFDIKNRNLFALDINSGFEVEPGLKDVEKVMKLINDIHYA